MGFLNKLVAAFGFVMLAMCIIAPTVSATDYSQMEKACETTLSDPESGLGIFAPIVSISPYQTTINYIGAPTTTPSAITLDISAIIGAYGVIVRKYPEAGDLLITTEDVNGDAVGTFTCKKSWVSGLDTNDESDIIRVVLKVLKTLEMA